MIYNQPASQLASQGVIGGRPVVIFFSENSAAKPTIFKKNILDF
jgi:hypothetical protein